MENKKEGTGIIYYQQPTEQFELDFDKINTVEDCVLVMRCIMSFLSNGYDSKVYVGNTCEWYEEMKHLAKDGSITKIDMR